MYFKADVFETCQVLKKKLQRHNIALPMLQVQINRRLGNVIETLWIQMTIGHYFSIKMQSSVQVFAFTYFVVFMYFHTYFITVDTDRLMKHEHAPLQ